MRRLCLDCPALARPGRSRCAPCLAARERARGTRQQRGLGADYQRARRQVLTEERHCWLCGQPARPGDPLTADHVIPRDVGGQSVRANLRAAHLSCNAGRGGGAKSLQP